MRKLQGLEKEVEENSQRFGKLWSSIQAEDVNIINHLTLVDIQQTLDAATNGFKERRKKYGSKIDAKEAQKTIVRITSLSMDDVLKDFAHFREVLEKQTSIKNEHYDIRTEIYEEYSRVQTAQISRLETIRSRFSPRPEAGLENIGTGYYSDDEPLFEDPGQSGFGDDDMMDITHGSRQGSPDTSMFGVPRDAQQENLERNKWAEGAEYPYFFNK